MFVIFVFGAFSVSPSHRVCQRDESGAVISCKSEYWDPNIAQIPCEHLPVEFIECITHSFDKFVNEFENGTLPEGDGCPMGHRYENSFGVAVCQPMSGITCIGERFWLNTTYPCYESGEYSVVTAVIFSFWLGIFGADRFYLGHHFLGILKLVTIGGFFIWWIADFVLLVLGQWGPKTGSYSIFY